MQTNMLGCLMRQCRYVCYLMMINSPLICVSLPLQTAPTRLSRQVLPHATGLLSAVRPQTQIYGVRTVPFQICQSQICVCGVHGSDGESAGLGGPYICCMCNDQGCDALFLPLDVS